MYYAGTVWLRMSEETFWMTTPRKLFALIDVHMDMWKAQWGNGEKSDKSASTPISYIDQINW